MKSHHKIQQYVCNQCPRRFTQVTSLNQHLLLHSGFSGLVCPQCPDKTFKQQTQLHQHMKTHGLSFPFECNKCEEKFLQLAHFNQHMALHEEFKFRCTMCSSSFNQEALLKKHMQRHIDGRYHQCPECPKGFTMKNQLTKHLQLEHASSEATRRLNTKKSQSAVGKHNCYFDNCDAFFNTAELLNQHLNSVHGLALVKNNSGKRNKTMEIMFSEQLKNLKDEQIPISLPLGISLPLPPFNPLNGHSSLHPQQQILAQAPQMTAAVLQHHVQQQLNQHHQQQQQQLQLQQQQQQQHQHQNNTHAHAITTNNISKENNIKDIKNKCHECNIVYPNDTDFRVHMYYKHYQTK